MGIYRFVRNRDAQILRAKANSQISKLNLFSFMSNYHPCSIHAILIHTVSSHPVSRGPVVVHPLRWLSSALPTPYAIKLSKEAKAVPWLPGYMKQYTAGEVILHPVCRKIQLLVPVQWIYCRTAKCRPLKTPFPLFVDHQGSISPLHALLRMSMTEWFVKRYRYRCALKTVCHCFENRSASRAQSLSVPESQPAKRMTKSPSL